MKKARRKFWFALSVDVFDHEIVGLHVKTPKAADPTKTVLQPFAVWAWLLGEAAYQERHRVINGAMVHLLRGQTALSERYLAKKANWTRRGVTTFLQRLRRHNMVSLSTVGRDGQLQLDFSVQKTAPGGAPAITIITICNYDKYQVGSSGNRARDRASTAPAPRQIHTENNDTVDNNKKKDTGVRVSLEAGHLQLHGELKAFWLEKFDSDEGALELGLLQAAGYVHTNGMRPLEAQVSSQLAKQLRDKRERDARALKGGATVTPLSSASRGRMSPQAWKAAIGQ